LITAVCTTPDEPGSSGKAFGARLAFTDFRIDGRVPKEIDASRRVRGACRTTTDQAAIEAGKPVYTSWPLGRTTGEQKADGAGQGKGVQTACGLRMRVSPTLL